MKNRKWTTLLLVLVLAPLLMGNDGCRGDIQVSGSGAEQATLFEIPRNAKGNTVEQQNILDRIAVTTDPTKVMWIHLIALDGNIIRRMAVRNKVTSSGKRTEPVTAANTGGGYPDSGFYIPGTRQMWETTEFIQADGTFGSSDNYIYWFDPMGRYHQWGTAGGLGYLITDYPIDLDDQMDEITGMYNAHKAASEWQAEEEERLRQHEAELKRERARAERIQTTEQPATN